MAEEVDYYAVLGLPPHADDTAIRLAYRRLARRYHPDIAGEESLPLMQLLNVAYQTLSDPERRRVYDANRPAPSPPTTEPPPTTHRPKPPTPPPTPATHRTGTGTVSASTGPLRRIAALDDGQLSPIVSVAMAHDGAVVAAGHIDGQIAHWDVAQNHVISRLTLDTAAQAGTLSEVRISADGKFLLAWGFALGLRVWFVADGAVRWSSRMNAPSGLMDAVFLPHPAGLVRLALPDAPQALADDDPFYWADRGRRGTAVYTRPLPVSGPISPAWATPLRCYEVAPLSKSARPSATPWQIRERVLSDDGRRLLTFSTGKPDGRLRSQVLRLWDLEARSRRGGVEPRRIAELSEPDGRLTFPLATTPNCAIVALADFTGHMQIRSLDGRVRHTIATGPMPLDAFAALSPDGALLAVAHGQRLDLWEARTSQRLQSWQLPAPLSALGFAPAAHPLLAIGLPDGSTELWA